MKENELEKLFNDVESLSHRINENEQESDNYSFVVFADRKLEEGGILSGGASGTKSGLFRLFSVLFNNDKELCEIALKAAIPAYLKRKTKDKRFVDDILKKL